MSFPVGASVEGSPAARSYPFALPKTCYSPSSYSTAERAADKVFPENEGHEEDPSGVLTHRSLACPLKTIRNEYEFGLAGGRTPEAFLSGHEKER